MSWTIANSPNLIWTMNMLCPILSSRGHWMRFSRFVCEQIRALDSYREHCEDFCLGQPPPPYHPPEFSSIVPCLHSMYSTSPRGLVISSRRVWYSVSVPLFSRGACQHQLCISLLWERAWNTNKPHGRHTVMHPPKAPMASIGETIMLCFYKSTGI